MSKTENFRHTHSFITKNYSDTRVISLVIGQDFRSTCPNFCPSFRKS